MITTDREIAKIKFQDQLDKLLAQKGIIEHHGWEIDVNSFDIYILMHPIKHVEIKFLARLRCDNYPQQAPSFQFIDKDTKNEGAAYWPQQGSAFKAAISRSSSSPQLCIVGIREFHEGCHNNDLGRPWDPEKYPFAKILQDVQVLLDKAYEG